jgi:hypothetical protein
MSNIERVKCVLKAVTKYFEMSKIEPVCNFVQDERWCDVH